MLYRNRNPKPNPENDKPIIGKPDNLWALVEKDEKEEYPLFGMGRLFEDDDDTLGELTRD